MKGQNENQRYESPLNNNLEYQPISPINQAINQAINQSTVHPFSAGCFRFIAFASISILLLVLLFGMLLLFGKSTIWHLF
jgi:hypothetical protein